MAKNTKKKSQKKKKQTTISFDKVHIILSVLLIILLSFLSVKNLALKEKNKTRENKMEEKLEEEFTFQVEKNAKKEIILNIKNDSAEKKNYDLELTNIQNELTDTSTLSYEIFFNQEQKVFYEIFPTNAMKLVDGAEVEAFEDLEIKFILNYQENKEDIGKSISAKLSINEAIETETIDK